MFLPTVNSFRFALFIACLLSIGFITGCGSDNKETSQQKSTLSTDISSAKAKNQKSTKSRNLSSRQPVPKTKKEIATARLNDDASQGSGFDPHTQTYRGGETENSGEDVFVPKEYDPAMLQQEFEYAIQITDPADRRRAFSELGQLIAQQDPDIAMEFLSQIEDKRDRLSFAMSVTGTMLKTSPELAAQWVDQAPDDIKSSTSLAVAKAWAKTDVGAAINWSNELTDSKMMTRALEEITRIWAASDLEGSYEWAVGIEDPELQNRIFIKMGETFAKTDPESAALWALEFENKSARSRILTTSIRQWASKDLAGVVDWVEKMDSSDSKYLAASNTAAIWARKDPVSATAWSESLDDERSRSMAINASVALWANKNPQQAFEWASSLADNDSAKIPSMTRVVKSWSWKDDALAREWVQTVRDTALQERLSRLIDQIVTQKEKRKK